MHDDIQNIFERRNHEISEQAQPPVNPLKLEFRIPFDWLKTKDNILQQLYKFSTVASLEMHNITFFFSNVDLKPRVRVNIQNR